MASRRTNRAERLLDLVSLFLAADTPVTWTTLQESFPADYAAGGADAALRKWERDKAELLELGVPLHWVQGDEDQADGYVVDRESYYLKDLELTPEERALLSLAGAAALQQSEFPLRTDLAHALDKLLFGVDPRAREVRADVSSRLVLHLPTSGTEQQAGVLEALGRSVANRKDVTFRYRSFAREETRRTVSPYGLAYRRGAWFLVGNCHLRQGLRIFHVERLDELTVNEAKPRTPDFVVPEAFDLRAHVGREPWEFAVHEVVEVVLLLDPQVALLARPKFGEAARIEELDGGAVRVALGVSNADAILREVLQLAPHAELVEPAPLRVRVMEAAQALAAAHGEPCER